MGERLISRRNSISTIKRQINLAIHECGKGGKKAKKRRKKGKGTMTGACSSLPSGDFLNDKSPTKEGREGEGKDKKKKERKPHHELRGAFSLLFILCIVTEGGKWGKKKSTGKEGGREEKNCCRGHCYLLSFAPHSRFNRAKGEGGGGKQSKKGGKRKGSKSYVVDFHFARR